MMKDLLFRKEKGREEFRGEGFGGKHEHILLRIQSLL